MRYITYVTETQMLNHDMYITAGFPHIFKNHFTYFFNTFPILNFRSSIPWLVFIFRNF